MNQLTPEVRASEDPSLGRDSLLVVVPRLEKGFSTQARQISGAKRLMRGLYRVRANDPLVMKLLDQYPHVSFKRVRDVPRVRELSPEGASEHTYTIVAYRFANSTPQQKKMAQRLTRRTPSVRLRRGALLFPHLRMKDKNRYYKPSGKVQLFTAKLFVERMDRLGAQVIRFSRLRITGEHSNEIVNAAIDAMVEHELGSVEKRIRQLLTEVEDPSISSKRIKDRYSELSRRLKVLRASFEIVQDVWHHDTEKSLKRTYNLLLRLRREVEMRLEEEPNGANERTASP